jgi:phosphoribosylanthranilate isomerase
VRPEVKFCGLTRAEDVDCAAELGATHVGFVFAESPRRTTPARAADMTRELPEGIRKVGVFVDATCDEMVSAIATAGLQVVQLHDRRLLTCVDALRGTGVEIWSVVHVEDGRLPAGLPAIAAGVDMIVLDTRVGKRAGGTGVPFDWHAVRSGIDAVRPSVRVGVAGGLRPENVSDAIRALDPDLVDVSSGVEAQPGIKDPGRMRAFVQGVRMGAWS